MGQVAKGVARDTDRSGLELVIGGANEVRMHARGWATTVISTTPVIAPTDRRACVLPFRDTVDARHPEAFTDELAGRFAAFAGTIEDRPQERVVVACRAGLSRSPALAFGLLVAVGRHPQRALRDVLAARPHARPNHLVVRRLDDALGLDGTMVGELDRWARRTFWWIAAPQRALALS